MSPADPAREPQSSWQSHDWIEVALPRALAFAQSLVRDLSTAEDLVHDCVFRLWQKRDQYDLPRDGQRLLLKSITNAAIDRARRRHLAVTDEAATLGDIPASDPPVFQKVLLLEMESYLEDALGKLSVNQRAALQLSSLGYSLREIAESLGVSESNAGVLIHRARHSMAEHLRPYLDQD
ncbi:MAG: RNA polymerase sigma factor [Planctomycetaceae bacterium]